jgi:hypothetical protein
MMCTSLRGSTRICFYYRIKHECANKKALKIFCTNSILRDLFRFSPARFFFKLAAKNTVCSLASTKYKKKKNLVLEYGSSRGFGLAMSPV